MLKRLRLGRRSTSLLLRPMKNQMIKKMITNLGHLVRTLQALEGLEELFQIPSRLNMHCLMKSQTSKRNLKKAKKVALRFSKNIAKRTNQRNVDMLTRQRDGPKPYEK